MKDRLEQIKAQALEQIKASDMPEKLNEVRVKFLGKKGELTAVLKGNERRGPRGASESRTAWSNETKSCNRRAFRRDKSENGGSHP